MTEYEVDRTMREKKCDKNAPISHLLTGDPDKKVYSVPLVKAMIMGGDKLWSYVYQNGKKIAETKIKVEIIKDKEKGEYLRTQRDGVEGNNLLELPIYYKNERGNYSEC